MSYILRFNKHNTNQITTSSSTKFSINAHYRLYILKNLNIIIGAISLVLYHMYRHGLI